MHPTNQAVLNKIALLPLDERPVNTGLVKDVAQSGGYELVLPSSADLSQFRTPGNTANLEAWLLSQAQDPQVKAVVLSVDMLVYGGLIAARTTHDSVIEVVSRLGVISSMKALRPDLVIFAVSLVTRASDSYSNVEEPEYWAQYGRELHSLGGLAHKAWKSQDQASVETEVPSDVRSDYAVRRLRNHIVNLAVIDLFGQGTVDYAAITADDTAVFSAGSVEQQWLNYWSILDPHLGLPIYPGADETGAVLVSRALCTLESKSPTVLVTTADPEGMHRTPPYENAPIAESVTKQIHTAGGAVFSAEHGQDTPDLVLVVHTSDPARGDQFSLQEPVSSRADAQATVDLVRTHISQGHRVALADLRFANGADPLLIAELHDAGLLDKLASYGGWNTAGNALGSTVALGLATVLGASRESETPHQPANALMRRVLDDYAYQSVARREEQEALFNFSIAPLPHDQVVHAEQVLTRVLQEQMTRLFPTTTKTLTQVTLPWQRSFEVDIVFSNE